MRSPAEFAQIFDRHFDGIHRYLCKRVGPSLGEELASQTFLTALEGRGRFDLSREDAGPWLYGIATNLIRNNQRQEQRRLRAYARAGAQEAEDPLDGTERRLDAARLRPQLVALLMALSPEESDPLLLFAWGELSYEEIAEALELPLGTVRSRLSRVRTRLREQLRLEQPITGDKSFASAEVDHG